MVALRTMHALRDLFRHLRIPMDAPCTPRTGLITGSAAIGRCNDASDAPRAPTGLGIYLTIWSMQHPMLPVPPQAWGSTSPFDPLCAPHVLRTGLISAAPGKKNATLQGFSQQVEAMVCVSVSGWGRMSLWGAVI